MGQIRSVTRAFAVADREVRPPGEVLSRLNRYTLALGEDQLFTVIYAIVDQVRGTISWSNAGHLPPLVRAGDGTVGFLEGRGYPMGVDDIEYGGGTRSFDSGARLVLYTDGLVERRDRPIDDGLQLLADVVRSGPGEPAALIEHVLAEVLSEGEALNDDVTAVIVGV
jgi:serine phosphatase RsbU (regulator of sigma subunit)